MYPKGRAVPRARGNSAGNGFTLTLLACKGLVTDPADVHRHICAGCRSAQAPARRAAAAARGGFLRPRGAVYPPGHVGRLSSAARRSSRQGRCRRAPAAPAAAAGRWRAAAWAGWGRLGGGRRLAAARHTGGGKWPPATASAGPSAMCVRLRLPTGCSSREWPLASQDPVAVYSVRLRYLPACLLRGVRHPSRCACAPAVRQPTAQRLAGLAPGKSTPLLLYCKHG
jgi:hypothetical protein